MSFPGQAQLFEALDKAKERIAELEEELAQAYSVMRDVADFAEAHHGDQPLHVILHGLTIDVVCRLRDAIPTKGDE